jgi:integrase/recombinase XerD
MHEIISTTESPPECVAGNTDAEFIALWLKRQRSAHTRRSYAKDLGEFQAFTGGKPLREIRMADVQAFADTLGGLGAEDYETRDGRAASTHARILSTLKSLLSFAHRTGYLPYNVGQAVSAPRVPETLAERILTEAEVLLMIHGERNARNRVVLILLYASGARVSELTRLEWRHVKPAEDGAHVTLFGKGGKTRTVRVPKAVANALDALRSEICPDVLCGTLAGYNAADGAVCGGADDATSDRVPVFACNKGGKLSVSAVWRIVRAAARRAGIRGDVSPHWIRHCTASHALDRGCSLAVVKETLGHSSLATSSRYIHAKPTDSAGLHLPI